MEAGSRVVAFARNVGKRIWLAWNLLFRPLRLMWAGAAAMSTLAYIRDEMFPPAFARYKIPPFLPHWNLSGWLAAFFVLTTAILVDYIYNTQHEFRSGILDNTGTPFRDDESATGRRWSMTFVAGLTICVVAISTLLSAPEYTPADIATLMITPTPLPPPGQTPEKGYSRR